jgi:SprT protein
MNVVPLSALGDFPVERPISKIKVAPIPRELKTLCAERICACIRAIRAKGFIVAMPTVSYDLRGKTAGKAYLRENHIQLNAVLLLENREEFVADTPGHEAAHLAAYANFGQEGRGHGVRWAEMMRLIGQRPARTHNYDVTNSRVHKTYAYRCNCQAFNLGIRRHKAGLAGKLICKKCKGILRHVPSGDMATTRPSPVPPFAGSAQSGSSPRPATAAMLGFAASLSATYGQPVPPDKSFEAISQFISELKRQPAPEPPPSGRQLEYAKSLAKAKGLTVPSATWASRKMLSAWISTNC